MGFVMKVYGVDNQSLTLYIQFDFWEIEELGFDVVNQKTVFFSFYSNVLDIIDKEVKKHFPTSFNYGVKTYIDNDNGTYVYKVYKYSDALNDFVFSEMKRMGRNVFFYPNHIWNDDN